MRRRYVIRDGKLVPKPPGPVPVSMRRDNGFNFAPMVMRDCYHYNEVRSPVDRSILDSRVKLREHNRRNDVEDIGNDASFREPQIDHAAGAGEGVGEDLRTAFEMYDVH